MHTHRYNTHTRVCVCVYKHTCVSRYILCFLFIMTNKVRVISLNAQTKIGNKMRVLKVTNSGNGPSS